MSACNKLGIIFGLFFGIILFGINFLQIALTWLTLNLAAVIEFFAGIVNAVV